MSSQTTLVFLLGLALPAIAGVPLYQYFVKHRRDLFEPVYLGAIAFLLMFWFRSVAIVAWGSELLGDPPFTPDILAAWNLSWLYLLLAVVLFYSAYYSQLGERVARAIGPLPGRWDPRRTNAVIWILFVVGLAALLALIRRFGSLTSFLFEKEEVFTTLGVGPLVLLCQSVGLSLELAYAHLLLRRTRAAWVVFIVVAIVAIPAQAVQEMKGAFLFLLLSLLILRHYFVRPVRLRAILVLAAVAVFVVFPVFTALRQPSDAPGVEGGWAEGADAVQTLDIAAQRFAGIQSLVFIVRDTPRVMDYQWGKTYLGVFVAWIPRELWPEKPVTGFGQVFTPVYLGHVFVPGGTTYAPTIFGEAYVNFHVFGIILVAIAGGAFLRAFYEHTIMRNRNPSGILIYAITLPYVLVGLEAHSVAWLTTAWLFLVCRGLSSLVAERRPCSPPALASGIARAER